MARPPDGSSSWVHSANRHELIDEDGTRWAALHEPLAGSSLSLSFPYSGSHSDHFVLLTLVVEAKGVVCRYRHPKLAAAKKCVWTKATTSEDLVPWPDVHARGKFEGHVESAPRIARLSAAGGELRVDDALGRRRIVLALGRIPDADAGVASGASGALRVGDAIAVGFLLLAPGATRVVTVPTSLP